MAVGIGNRLTSSAVKCIDEARGQERFQIDPSTGHRTFTFGLCLAGTMEGTHRFQPKNGWIASLSTYRNKRAEPQRAVAGRRDTRVVLAGELRGAAMGLGEIEEHWPG